MADKSALTRDGSSAVKEQHTRWTTATGEDIFISLVKAKKENGSFGNGVALSEMRYR